MDNVLKTLPGPWGDYSENATCGSARACDNCSHAVPGIDWPFLRPASLTTAGLSVYPLNGDQAKFPRRPRATRALDREHARDRLIRRGVELLAEHSFDGTGRDVITSGHGIPKGSFYYHFASKQAYAEEVIDAYAAYFDARFDRLFGDETQSPLNQLRDYIKDGADGMARHDWRRGCLVGNLAQELGAHNEAFRSKLNAVLDSWQLRISDCLKGAVAAGELDPTSDIDSLARLFWIG